MGCKDEEVHSKVLCGINEEKNYYCAPVWSSEDLPCLLSVYICYTFLGPFPPWGSLRKRHPYFGLGRDCRVPFSTSISLTGDVTAERWDVLLSTHPGDVILLAFAKPGSHTEGMEIQSAADTVSHYTKPLAYPPLKLLPKLWICRQ